jgi:hypothetical protein
MSKLFEVEAIQSEIAATEAMLRSMPSADKIGIIGMRERLLQLKDELARFEGTHDTFAETILYFGGAPVEGSSGISAAFASDALGRYQDLITSVFASEKCKTQLSDTGPLPCRQESTLHITGTPRGSFGFQLKEIVPQGLLLNSGLQDAVEKATSLIELAKGADQEKFQDAIAEEDQRVLGFLKAFLKTLSSAKSSARIVTRQHDVSLDSDSVTDAHNNVELTTVTNFTTEVRGEFKGARIISRDFDFVSDEGVTIKGKISQEIPDDRIHKMDLEYTGTKCVATMLVTEATKANSNTVKRKWLLTDICPV